MLKKIFLLIVSILMLYSLSSCNLSSKNEYASLFNIEYSSEYKIFNKINTPKLALCTYNSKDFIVDNNDDTMQYPFTQNNGYYTSGSSVDNHFKIINVKDEKINVIYEEQDKDNVALFPLDEFNSNLYFIKTMYGDVAPYKSVICIYQDNKLIELENTECYSILSGTIINNQLYYISYDKQTHKKNIMLYNLITKDKPIIYKQDTESEILYKYNDSLIYNDSQKIYVNGYSYNYTAGNYLYINNDIGLLIVGSTNEIGEIRIYDTKTSNLIKSFSNVEGVRVNLEEIEILYNNNTEIYRWDSYVKS